MDLKQSSNIMNTDKDNKKINIKEIQKINGFTQKINIQQILSYIVVGCLFLVFTFCILPTLSLAVQIISGILYYGSFIAMFILGYICTNFDPTDQYVIKEKTAKLNNLDYDVSDLDFYCVNCKTHVSSESKHCKACNRCVENFDHHCKWLNNCVGQVNYSLFFKLITTLLIHIIIFTIFICISLFKYYFQNDDEPSISKDLFFTFSNDSSVTVNVFEILLWIFLIVGVLVGFFDGNLVLFHIYLQKKNLSTYQYILNSREKKQMEQSKRQQMQEMRLREKEEQKKLKEEKKQKDLQNFNTSLPAQQTPANTTQNQNNIKNTHATNLRQITQSSYIYTPQPNNNNNNNNSINFQNQNIIINEDKNGNNLVSRQDSMETHSQRTNPFEFADQKRGFATKGNSINSQFSLKKNNKTGFWAKVCCCFKSQKSEAKIGAIGLTKIDEQSEFMEEKEDQKDDNFAVIDEMNQRGICQTVDIMDDIQKMKNPYSERQLNFEIDNNEIYINQAVQVLQANKKILNKSININENNNQNQRPNKLQLERFATEEQSLKQLPHEGGFQSNQDEQTNSNNRSTKNQKIGFKFENQIDLKYPKSGLDIVSVNLTQKSDSSPVKKSEADKINKNSSALTEQKRQHIPPNIIYLRSGSKSSLKSNQQSSNGEVQEIKTEDKHNSLPPSQIQVSNIINMQPVQIKQNQPSENEINL